MINPLLISVIKLLSVIVESKIEIFNLFLSFFFLNSVFSLDLSNELIAFAIDRI